MSGKCGPSVYISGVLVYLCFAKRFLFIMAWYFVKFRHSDHVLHVTGSCDLLF